MVDDVKEKIDEKRSSKKRWRRDQMYICCMTRADISDVAVAQITANGMVGMIMETCNCELDDACIPENWRFSILLPLYKGKRDVRDCEV